MISIEAILAFVIVILIISAIILFFYLKRLENKKGIENKKLPQKADPAGNVLVEVKTRSSVFKLEEMSKPEKQIEKITETAVDYELWIQEKAGLKLEDEGLEKSAEHIGNEEKHATPVKSSMPEEELKLKDETLETSADAARIDIEKIPAKIVDEEKAAKESAVPEVISVPEAELKLEEETPEPVKKLVKIERKRKQAKKTVQEPGKEDIESIMPSTAGKVEEETAVEQEDKKEKPVKKERKPKGGRKKSRSGEIL